MPRNRPQSSSADAPTQPERTKHICFLIWAIIGILILVVAAAYVLGQVLAALVAVALAALIVFILRVPVAWFERHRVPRWAGSLIAYLGGVLVIALVMLIFIPVIWEQTLGLIQLIPDNAAKATDAFNAFYQQYNYLLEDSNIQQLVGRAASELSAWAGNMVSQSAQGVITFGTGLITSIMVLMMALIVGFWVLKDLPTIGRELRIIIGPKHEEEVLFVASALSRAFGGYLRGITVAGLCTGVISGIGYYFIGLPYPAVLGLFTGLMNFIPYVGPWISGIITALIGLFISPLAALFAIIVTLLAQQITDNFITPRIMSSVVDLHPAIVLVGVFAGGALGGIPGLIIAIPLLSATKSIFVHYFEGHTGRHLSDEKGALFKLRPAQAAAKEDADADVGSDVTAPSSDTPGSDTSTSTSTTGTSDTTGADASTTSATSSRASSASIKAERNNREKQ
jgi:predicted PurR-regulated permease PerM